jgi:hypothetical protein
MTRQGMPTSTPVVATGTWCSYEIDEVVGWAADFDFSTPAQMLLDWQHVLFSAAERYGIFRVVEAEFRGYRRDRDGDIGGFLLAHPDRVPRNDARVPRGFLPEALASRVASQAVTRTLLEYQDTDGVLRSAWIGELTEAYPDVPLPRYFPQRAIDISAHNGPTSDPDVDSLCVRIASSVDIWFPWNIQIFRYPGQDRVDNRYLSRLNGRRLNGFLAEVRAATLAAGGTWRMNPRQRAAGRRQAVPAGHRRGTRRRHQRTRRAGRRIPGIDRVLGRPAA